MGEAWLSFSPKGLKHKLLPCINVQVGMLPTGGNTYEIEDLINQTKIVLNEHKVHEPSINNLHITPACHIFSMDAYIITSIDEHCSHVCLAPPGHHDATSSHRRWWVPPSWNVLGNIWVFSSFSAYHNHSIFSNTSLWKSRLCIDNHEPTAGLQAYNSHQTYLFLLWYVCIICVYIYI